MNVESALARPNKNIGTQGVQEFFFCELKAPEGSSTHWTLNSYDEVNPTSLYGYDVQSKNV